MAEVQRCFKTLILDDIMVGSYGASLDLVLAIKTLVNARTLEDLLLKHMVLFKRLARGVGLQETLIKEGMVLIGFVA